MAEVRFLGRVRALTGVSTKQVESATVREALIKLAQEYGPKLEELLFPEGGVEGNNINLNTDVLVLVNGRNINFIGGLDTALDTKDRVTLIFHGAKGYPGG